MIPKIIHYCWLSNEPYTEKINYCINSWKKNLPDYEIVLWDLKRFDINSSNWVKQAFMKKKYAFAADYIRCYALYHYGGIYLDSDVEVLKSFNDILDLPYFMGVDCSNAFEPAIVGFEKGDKLFKEMLNYYDNNEFILRDGSLNVIPLPKVMEDIASSYLCINKISNRYEFDNNPSILNLFPSTYFSPKRQDNLKVTKSSDTYTIHHFNASWYSNRQKVFRFISKIFGYEFAVRLSKFVRR